MPPLFRFLFAALFFAITLFPKPAISLSQQSLELFIQEQALKIEAALQQKLEEKVTDLEASFQRKLESVKAELEKRIVQLQTEKESMKSAALDDRINARAISMPKSCSDLKNLGNSVSGFYTVTGREDVPTKLETVFCNFNVSQLNPDFETRLGFNDIKSSSIYFSVRRQSDYDAVGSTIPFELEFGNVGGGMNLTSGVFTAPVDGVYFFLFSGISGAGKGVSITLRYHSVASSTYSDLGMATGSSYDSGTASIHSTVSLKKGDSIFLYFIGGVLHDDGHHHTAFAGYLLEENLVLV